MPHEGIPDPALANIETALVGTRMARLAAKRRKPVQICTLQTDDSVSLFGLRSIPDDELALITLLLSRSSTTATAKSSIVM